MNIAKETWQLAWSLARSRTQSYPMKGSNSFVRAAEYALSASDPMVRLPGRILRLQNYKRLPKPINRGVVVLQVPTYGEPKSSFAIVCHGGGGGAGLVVAPGFVASVTAGGRNDS